ncbi:unnamed protein product, partial [Staurois parvus]
MGTDRWPCWGYTDHQSTLIISALMITGSVTAHEERNVDNRHFPVWVSAYLILAMFLSIE